MISTTAPAPVRRGALIFIFGTVVLDMLAFGIIIPVLPKLIEQFLDGNTAAAARMYGYFGIAWAVMQFLCSPILGSLSDRYGRRPVILLSCFGLGVDFMLMALAPTLVWLFIGRLVSGITASSFSMASAYVADVTPPERRASAFGMIGAAFGIGFILGPAIGGVLGHYDPRLPFWFAGALAICNALYGYFVLPESLPRERRSTRINWGRANPVGSLRLLREHRGLLRLAGVYFLYQFAHYVLPSTSILYSSYRFGWDARQLGLMMAATGFCNLIVQVLLVRRAVARFGERRTLVIGLVFASLGYIGFGLMPTGSSYLAVIPVFALCGLVMPGLQALMTQRVPMTEQGRLQGANASLMGLAGIIAPGVFSQLFALVVGLGAIGANWVGAAMLLAGMLTALAVLLVLAEPERGPALPP